MRFWPHCPRAEKTMQPSGASAKGGRNEKNRKSRLGTLEENGKEKPAGDDWPRGPAGRGGYKKDRTKVLPSLRLIAQKVRSRSGVAPGRHPAFGCESHVWFTSTQYERIFRKLPDRLESRCPGAAPRDPPGEAVICVPRRLVEEPGDFFDRRGYRARPIHGFAICRLGSAHVPRRQARGSLARNLR